jgi:hypothetical protein
MLSPISHAFLTSPSPKLASPVSPSDSALVSVASCHQSIKPRRWFVSTLAVFKEKVNRLVLAPQFAANHHTADLSSYSEGLHPGTTPAHCTPPSRGGGGSRDVQQPRRSSTPPPAHNFSPLPHAFFSPGVDGCRPGVLQEPSPGPPASPTTGVAGRVCRLAGTHHLTDSHTVSNPLHSPGPALIDMARLPISSQPSQPS